MSGLFFITQHDTMLGYTLFRHNVGRKTTPMFFLYFGSLVHFFENSCTCNLRFIAANTYYEFSQVVGD